MFLTLIICYAFCSVKTILNFVCLSVELNLSVCMIKYPLLSHVKLQFPQLCDGNNVIFFHGAWCRVLAILSRCAVDIIHDISHSLKH